MFGIGAVGCVALAVAVVAFSSVIALALVVASVVCGVMALRWPRPSRGTSRMRWGVALVVGLVAAWVVLLVAFFALAPSI